MLPRAGFSFRDLFAVKYNKPALSNADLLARWQIRTVPSAQTQNDALNFIGFFPAAGLCPAADDARLWAPVQAATFDDIPARYELDRDLRRITLGQLERIEVAVPTCVIQQRHVAQYGPSVFPKPPAQVLGRQLG